MAYIESVSIMQWPLTFQCSNNCINCILDTRVAKHKGDSPIGQVKDAIDKTPEGEIICFTGGEPTLNKGFFELLQYAKEKQPKSLVFVLSNGRRFSDKKFLARLPKFEPGKLRFGVPLYSHGEKVHDKITRVEGSWSEAVKGIKNLLEIKQKVELRVLIEKANYQELEETAEFIAKNFPGLERVVFINLRYTGNAFIHRDKVFVRYSETVPFVQKAVDVLKGRGFDVMLFHFPLCILGRKYWPLAEGITKQEFDLTLTEKCSECSVKGRCARIWKSYLPLAGAGEFKPVP